MVRIAFAVLALLSGVGCAAAETKNIDQTVSLAATGSVTLETHNGSIDVHTWDRPQIEIHARIESWSGLPEDLRRLNDTTVEVTSTSDSVRIISKYADYPWSWFGSNPSIHYTITAPKTARWTIRDHNGRAELHDVNGALNVDTHNGSLRVVNLGGPLEVSSHNGSISVDFASFQGATIMTYNGSTELSLPSSSSFDLHADSRHERVESDFPMVIRTLGRRWESVEGTVNGGGARLRYNSHNGGLRLMKK
jgi:hypothetical protein